jgi:predicted PurR-regulated permease PerM
MNGIFQPLFGGKPKEDPESIRRNMDKLVGEVKQEIKDFAKNAKVNQTAPLPIQAPQAQPQASAVSTISPIVVTNSLNKLKSAKSQLEGFVSDNKTVLTIIVFILILLVLAYIIYNQQKQEKKLAVMKKKLLRMK